MAGLRSSVKSRKNVRYRPIFFEAFERGKALAGAKGKAVGGYLA
jgi:hypothetical protein